MKNGVLLTQSEHLRKKAQMALNNHRRTARKYGVELEYGRDDLLTLLVEARQCAYCRMPIGLDMEIDHAEPLARGRMACRLSNLVVTCKRCNSLKGMLDADEMKSFLAFLRSLDPRSEADIRRRLQAGAKPIYGRRKTK